MQAAALERQLADAADANDRAQVARDAELARVVRPPPPRPAARVLPPSLRRTYFTFVSGSIFSAI
jgi:hypothetical protein